MPRWFRGTARVGWVLLAAPFQALLGSVQTASSREEHWIHHLIMAQAFVTEIPFICITEQKKEKL